jgi:hypothetical protein
MSGGHFEMTVQNSSHRDMVKTVNLVLGLETLCASTCRNYPTLAYICLKIRVLTTAFWPNCESLSP